MSVRSVNWLKFGGLVGLAFVLGLMFASMLDLPKSSAAQTRDPISVIPAVQSTVPASVTMPLAALSDAFATVAEQIRPAVVYIRSRRAVRQPTTAHRLPPGFEEFFGRQRGGREPDQPQLEEGAGSGFVVSDQGYILTNNHVVAGAEEVTVSLIDRREFKAKVVGTDANTDIAVIKIDAPRSSLTPAKLGSSDATRVGEWVLAVGNPLGANLNFTVTSGIVSAKGRGQLPLQGAGNYSIQDFIQTDAAINRGNSGGPLVNVRGEVIGINSAIFSQTGFNVGYAFAIPIDLARQVMSQLISDGHVERAAIGVEVRAATPEDAAYVKLDEIRGVRVDGFSDGSPAQRAGLQRGDIIISVDGQPIEYVAQLQTLVGFKKPGTVVKVEVARKGGARRTYDVRLVAQAQPTERAQPTEDRDEEDAASDASAAIKDRLGIGVAPLSADLIQELGLPRSAHGVVVESVDPFGPANELLFPNSGEVITEIEGKDVRSDADLANALKGLPDGEIVSLTVYRPIENGEGQTVIVRVRVGGKRGQ